MRTLSHPSLRLSLLLIAAAAAAVLAVWQALPSQGAPTVTTDKQDYFSNEIVTVTGTGFSPNAFYDVPITRPDGAIVHGDGSSTPGWDTVQANASGNFTYYYQLDGIYGTYTIRVFNSPWGGPSSTATPLATATFTDADIDFTQCRNDSDNNNAKDDCEWSTGAINSINSLYMEGDSVPQRLFHRLSDAGAYTFGFRYEFTKANIYAYDFLTNVDATQSGALLAECANRPGFISLSQCNTMFGTNSFLVPIPSDPFDAVAARENPPGLTARNFKIGCTPACSVVSTILFPDDPTGPLDLELLEAHEPDSDPDCFKNCGTSDVIVAVTVTLLSSNTRVGFWFGGHLAQSADPPGSADGWGTGCGVSACGAGSISGSPFHVRYICLDSPPPGNCEAVGNRDNQIQIGAVVTPGTITIVKDSVPDHAQDFSFSGSLGSFSLDDDAEGTLPNSQTFSDLVPGSFTVTEGSVAGWTLSSITCNDGDGGTTVNLGTRTATIDLDPGQNITCTFTNNQDVVQTDVKITNQTVAAPASANAGASFTIAVQKTLHNNGPTTPTTVNISPSVAGPGDCTITAAAGNPTSATLATSTATNVTENFNVTCSQPSTHQFTINNCIATTGGVGDTNPSNNCAAQTQVSVNILATADLKVQTVTGGSPTSAAANTPFNVTASALIHNNGGFGAVNADATFTLSLPGDCTTSSPNPQTVNDVSLAVSASATVPGSPATWSVTCTNPSSHQFTANVSVAIDQLHVSDPTPGNNTGSKSLATNVFKEGDAKVSGLTVSGPGSAAAGASFSVGANATLHNNGPATPISVNIFATPTAPADCTVTPATSNPSTATLTMSTAAVVALSFNVSCTQPSNHSITVQVCVAVATQHVNDNTGNNNCQQASANVAINAQADLKVSGVSVGAPASAAAGTPFNVTVSGNLHNNGPASPVNADATLDLAVPGDCAKTPNTTQSVDNTSLATSTSVPVSKTWSVTCTSASSHSFSGSVSVAADQVHVTDPNGVNNSGSAGANTAITAQADVKISTPSVSAPASAAAGTPFNVTVSANLHNNGAASPVNADATLDLAVPGDCAKAPNTAQSVDNTNLATSTSVPVSKTWSVTCTNSSDHSFSGTVSVVTDQVHVMDPNGGNNSGSAGANTAITAQTDLKLVSVNASAPTTSNTDQFFGLTVTATLHNNGPASPVQADVTANLTLPADCTSVPVAGTQTQQNVTANSSTAAPVYSSWQVTCTNAGTHVFNCSAAVALDTLHVTDPSPAAPGTCQVTVELSPGGTPVVVAEPTPTPAPVGGIAGLVDDDRPDGPYGLPAGERAVESSGSLVWLLLLVVLGAVLAGAAWLAQARLRR